MQKMTMCLLFYVLSSMQFINAQDTIKNVNNQNKIEALKKSKSKIREEEKVFLKKEVEAINLRLENGEIAENEAQNLKEAAAKKRALNIENREAIIDNKIELLARNDQDDQSEDSNESTQIKIIIAEDEDDGFLEIVTKLEGKPKKYDKRTSSTVVLAIGFNNALLEGEKLEDSPYKHGGSGFVEMGYAWKTRVLNNSNFMRVKYGVSFQWNKLNIKNNQYLVNNDGVINLEPFPNSANKVKYRMTNLVFPVHLEFGPSKRIEKPSYYRYSTKNQLKFGVGFYGGFNLQSMQKLKYTDVNGNKAKDKLKGRYNASDLIYGPSAYLALGSVAVYFKYDLNPIFNDQAMSQNNISLGLRFDMD